LFSAGLLFSEDKSPLFSLMTGTSFIEKTPVTTLQTTVVQQYMMILFDQVPNRKYLLCFHIEENNGRYTPACEERDHKSFEKKLDPQLFY
jgi:hypothetical protein